MEEKKTAEDLREEIAREVGILFSRELARNRRAGAIDLEALEYDLRDAVHDLGARVLGGLLGSGGRGHHGPRLACPLGHPAEFHDYRPKTVTTVLGPVPLERAYYFCEVCHEGFFPRDRELDVVGTTLSPGVRRMAARLGAKEPFAEGRADLAELAGIEITTKEVERVSESTGEEFLELSRIEIATALSRRPLPGPDIGILYVAIDGTGVPIVPWEQEGHAAKEPGRDRARTREVKLGCVFTQTTVDEKGRPVRNPGSTTYVGAIETAEEFGPRIYAEAVRRGIDRARRVAVLGDGAPWIANLADLHFPGATRILDMYHAIEHLSEVAKAVYGPGSTLAAEWTKERVTEIEAGDVTRLLEALRKLHPSGAEQKDLVRRNEGYIRANEEAMRYDAFRAEDLFVGSGVVEAGCRVVIGERLKKSGMRWTVRGSSTIIALRCCLLSGRWDETWAARRSG